MDVEQVRWDQVGAVREEGYNFFMWKRKRKLGTGFCVHHRIVQQLREYSVLVIDCIYIYIYIYIPYLLA